MARLSNLPRSILRTIRGALAQAVRLSAMPWDFQSYCDAQGVLAPPGNLLSRLRELEGLEDAAVDLADIMVIVDGLHDVWDLAHEGTETEVGGDMLIRMFAPMLLISMKRDEGTRRAYPIVAAIFAADDKLAEHAGTRLLPERYAMLAMRAWRESAGGRQSTSLHRAAWLAAVATAAGYPYWRRLPTWTAEKLGSNWRAPDLHLTLGWESDLPLRDIDTDVDGEPPRPTPIWSAQRAFSLRREEPAPFGLTVYDDAALEDPPRAMGTHWAVACAPSTIEHAVAAGLAPNPHLWFGFELAAGLAEWRDGDWTFRLRGHGDGVVGIPISLSGEAAAAAGAGLEFEAVWAPEVDDAQEGAGLPEAGDCSFTVGSVAITAFGGGGVAIGEAGPAVAADEAGVAIRISKARLALSPSSALARALVRGGLTIELDLGIRFTTHRGLILEGSGGLDLYLSLQRAIGNRWLGASISYLRLRAVIDSGAEGTAILVEATAGVSISILRVTLTLAGIGARIALRTRDPRGNLLGIANVEGEVITPSTFGLAIDWGPLRGGGVFAYEADKDRYWGALELAWGKRWSLRGVGFCEARTVNGRTHHSLVALVTWERSSLSPGFDLTGIGVFVGTHRRADGDAMREGIVSGAIDAILFPADPIGQARSLVVALERFFPAAEPDQDTHVVGVLLKLSFAGGLAVGKLGFLVQFGTGSVNRTKIFVVFSAKLALRGSLARVLKLEMSGVGEYDAASGELEVRARLRNSRLCGANLDGELLVFRGDPLGGAAAPPPRTDAEAMARPGTGWFFSLGGYHPRWFEGKGPGRARVDQRIAVTIHKGDAITLEWTGYLALTPSAIHLGSRAHIVVSAAGFGIEGMCGFDGMVTYDWDFILDVFGQVRLILFSRTLCELGLEGTLRGSSPWSISGRVTYKVLWWSGSKCFSKQLTDETEPAATTPPLGQQVRTALTAPAAYAGAAPVDLTLVPRDRAGVWCAPERSVRASQNLAPLDVAISRLGAARLPRPTAATVSWIDLGGARVPHRAVTAEFAPGVFFNLSQSQALTAPASETLTAGFEVAHDAIAVGDDIAAVATYDAITIDRGQSVEPGPRPRELVGLDAALRARELADRAPSSVAPLVKVTRPTFASTAGARPSAFTPQATSGDALRRVRVRAA